MQLGSNQIFKKTKKNLKLSFIWKNAKKEKKTNNKSNDFVISNLNEKLVLSYLLY